MHASTTTLADHRGSEEHLSTPRTGPQRPGRARQVLLQTRKRSDTPSPNRPRGQAPHKGQIGNQQFTARTQKTITSTHRSHKRTTEEAPYNRAALEQSDNKTPGHPGSQMAPNRDRQTRQERTTNATTRHTHRATQRPSPERSLTQTPPRAPQPDT